MQSEPDVVGWVLVPTCLQCSYQVFERPAVAELTYEPGKRRRNPVLPMTGR